MVISVTISEDDVAEHYDNVSRHHNRQSTRAILLNIGFWLLISFAYLSVFGPIDSSHVVLFFGMLVAFVIYQHLQAARARKIVIEDSQNPALGSHEYTFDTDGIRFRNDLTNGFVSWAAVKATDESASLYRFFTGSFEAILIPKRDVGSRDEFREAIRIWRGSA